MLTDPLLNNEIFCTLISNNVINQTLDSKADNQLPNTETLSPFLSQLVISKTNDTLLLNNKYHLIHNETVKPPLNKYNSILLLNNDVFLFIYFKLMLFHPIYK